MKQSARIMIAVLAAMPAIAAACVDARNGTVCEQYEDIALTVHGNSLKLERRYNSGKAAYDGWFGHGWGTVYEARLTVLSDGSMQLDDPGSGIEERYAAPYAGGDKTGLARSARCERAGVARTQSGYRRTSCDGDSADFDAQGRLVAYCAGQDCMTIHYAGDRPDRIADAAGQQLLLGWDAEGHVAEVHTDSGDPVATYRYAGGDLVAASVPPDPDMSSIGQLVEAARREYRYVYDAQHRMTQSGKEGMPPRKVGYDTAGRVGEIRDGNGITDHYEYRADFEQPELHYWVTRIADADEASSARRYVAEYFLARDAVGKPMLRRVVKTVQSEGMPTRLVEEILLDAQERVITLHRASGEFADYRYEPRFGKVASVTTGDGRRDYRYDSRGQLMAAKDGDGRRVSLAYDQASRITRMVEHRPGAKPKVLTFIYNRDGKPERIGMSGRGEIRVQYDARGEIANVSSQQGAKMALAVMQAFQSLLVLVKQPGANLCP